jgi:ribosomal protein S18 acetylase RimI-like enzyme
MSICIRNFDDKDSPIIVYLLNHEYEGAYEFTPNSDDKIRLWIQHANVKIFVAEGREVLGVVAYRESHWSEEIEWLAVKDVEVKRAIEGIKLSSLKPEEEKEFFKAVNAGFGRERVKVGIIQRWKYGCPPFNEEWTQVAETNGEIVSVVASRSDAEYNKHFNDKRGYLGPAATISEYRGKNLASALACYAMSFLYTCECDSVALYTMKQNIPSVTLLQKLGFYTSHNWKFMRKIPSTGA